MSGKTPALKLTAAAEKKNINSVRRAFLDAVKNFTYSEELLSSVEVCLVEWVENIIKYAHHGTAKKFLMKVEPGQGTLTLRFTDSGGPFNPVKYQPPELSARFSAGLGGKMGIRSIKALCASVKYRREKGKNVVTMKFTEKPPGC